MKPSQFMSISGFRAFWEETMSPQSANPSSIIHTLSRLTALGIGMMSILLWMILCVEFLSGTTMLVVVTYLLAVLSLAALGIQIWRGSPTGWIGLKALLAFFVFIQSVEAMIQLGNVYQHWQYNWTVDTVWREGLSLFVSSFTLVVSLFLLVYVNQKALRSYFGISYYAQRATDFFIGIFAAIMLTIASLG